jgi:hypothetical protein
LTARMNDTEHTRFSDTWKVTPPLILKFLNGIWWAILCERKSVGYSSDYQASYERSIVKLTNTYKYCIYLVVHIYLLVIC